jgi:hypothetical protein
VGGDPINYIDPLGLWWFGDPLPQGMIDGFTGFGDGVYRTITLGIGDLQEIRDSLDIDGGLNKCSGAYKWGNVLGEVHGSLTLAGTLAAKAGWGLEFNSAHKGMGPHLHYGPKYPGSNHPMHHFGPKNPIFGSGNFSWSTWSKGGRPWRWK